MTREELDRLSCWINGAAIEVHRYVPLELKTVEQVLPVHEAQVLTYLRLLDKRIGLWVNFNVPPLVKGVHRIVNSF